MENNSTNMIVEGGYKESDDVSTKMAANKQSRGMNFPCPSPNCLLTFSTEKEMDSHMKSKSHVTKETMSTSNVRADKLKTMWVQGLSGKVQSRKSGIILFYNICIYTLR